MVTKDGRVKVLDFGLARMGGPMAEGAGGSELPTDLHTREGVVRSPGPGSSTRRRTACGYRAPDALLAFLEAL
jgi:hypothetical protein